MPKQRIGEIDILRGIAAILMILGHSFIVYPVDISQIPWCHYTGHFIYTFHMELFFVLAGAVYYCSDYKKFMVKKVKRILVPYIFFGIITLLLKAFGGAAINGVESTGEGIIKFLFRGGNYWFLYVLFILFAIYPWIEKLLKTWQAEAIFALAVLILRQFTIVTDYLAIRNVLYYLPYFVAGRLLFHRIYKEGNTSHISNRTRLGVLLIGLVVFLFIDQSEIRSGIEFGPILSFIRAMAIIAVLYILVEILARRNGRQGIVYKFIQDCGKYSLQLYLFNGFLLTALRIIICTLLHITTPVIIVAGIWIGNLVITLIACKIIIPRIPVVRDLCGLR